MKEATILALERTADAAELEEGENAGGLQVIVTAEDFEKSVRKHQAFSIGGR